MKLNLVSHILKAIEALNLDKVSAENAWQVGQMCINNTSRGIEKFDSFVRDIERARKRKGTNCPFFGA